jgi:non-canonical purine NTP pyrophosphatase (RdgB/HAM1 family)
MENDELIFVTSNEEKYSMVSEVFDSERNLERRDLDITEIQSLDAKAIVEDKAKNAYQKVEEPVIVDDFGFYFKDLERFPGPMIKHLMKEIGLKGLKKLEELTNGKCSMVCNVAYYDGEDMEFAEGKLEGKMDYRNANPDSKVSLMTAFIPEGHSRPVKDLEIDNHREKAFQKLKSKI